MTAAESCLVTALAGALQKLTMNGNQLSSIAPELGQLSSLKDLQLQGNHLTELPDQICDLKVSFPCLPAVSCMRWSLQHTNICICK